MAAPPVTPRSTPTGYKMPDGYQALIAMQNLPTINIWEMQVKPPGIDGGEPIETTTMHNKVWHTTHPRSLKKLTPAPVKVAYDPDVYTDILAQVNVNQGITVHYPDGSSLSFWGFLQKLEPGELKEGEFPEADTIFVPTNWDDTNKVEAGPVYTPASGT